MLRRHADASGARTIRPLEARDAAPLLELRLENREFMEPFDPERPESFYTLDGQREIVQTAVARREADAQYVYAILDDGEVAGTISISNVVRGAFQSANVGYWVDRRRNGRGLATRAVASIVEIAFGELGLHRLEAGTLVDNVASQRVLEKNRFRRFGVAPDYLLIAGRWQDHVLFQRTADD
jgi:[ribosomal protein S5]-alanine N-acetyltransferase